MSDAPAPTRAEEGRTGESGRTMRVMLSDEMRRRLKHGERVVIVRDIPWELFGEAGERQSENNHGQSLTRISERGGFHATEAVCVLTSMAWREGKTITEEQAHRILYAMTAFYRRGALSAEARAAQAEAEVARLTAALKLCLTELEWQVEQSDHCGDPNYECPLHDIHKPSDGHAEARAAARTALEAPHADK